MKSREKLEIINEKVYIINNTILKNKKWNLEYINRGANNYCLVIKVENNEEFFNGKFATYDSVLSALELILNMFDKKLNKEELK